MPPAMIEHHFVGLYPGIARRMQSGPDLARNGEPAPKPSVASQQLLKGGAFDGPQMHLGHGGDGDVVRFAEQQRGQAKGLTRADHAHRSSRSLLIDMMNDRLAAINYKEPAARVGLATERGSSHHGVLLADTDEQAELFV